jgi:thiamine pyrophosphokinase
MKSLAESVSKKLIAKYQEEIEHKDNKKSTDINILLNRVKVKQKNEYRKKIYFSAAASTGLLLFGLIIF